MKTLMIALVVAATLMGQAQVSQPPAAGLFRQHLADYDSELRRADGRVDIDALVARLKELGVTAYYWLIWHAPTDWDDLKLFLPRAARAGIEVWVYLVPPSESAPKYGSQYPEPFRLDYGRWAEEIAKLSLERPNLTAWVIDDFYANRAFFTPAYLREMQTRSQRINPRLALLPLMYFNEISVKFTEDYRAVIDGVVVAYLQDRDEIERTWAVLNDADMVPPSELSFPLGTPSQAGDFVMASRRRFHIPFVSMTAGDAGEFRQRHGDPATPERIAEYLRLSLQAWREGKCDGVVTYCLDKRPQSQTIPLAQKLFHEFRNTAAKTDAAPPFAVSDRQVRISAGVLERVIDLTNGNLSMTHLRVQDQDLLAGPAFEVSLIVTRAEPNARPKGLKPGEGGTIDSVKTFSPGRHVDPGAYDDATLGQTTRWVEPVRIRASQWADIFTLAKPEVSAPAPDVSRLTIRARARSMGVSPMSSTAVPAVSATGILPVAVPESHGRDAHATHGQDARATGSALDGLVLTVVYEVYRGEPVVRKWVEIANESSVWRKIEQLTIDDFALAPSISERVPLTPAGYGVGTSMIGFAASDGAFGVIAANEIPSGLKAIADTGALGYHPTRFEWVLGPGEKFVSEPVFLYAFSGPVQQTISARSTPLDRTVEGPFQRFLSRHIGITGERLPCDAPQWLTWATFGPDLNDVMIRQQADCAARAGFVQFLMDDGWQRDRLGTEPDRARFPDFAATAEYIRSRGLKLGLWLSCFRDANSPDLKAWPEARSLPVVTRLGGIAMSFTTPWREFYAQDLVRLHERYGAAYFKQDFSNILYGDLTDTHPNRTRKESLLRGLRGLLEAQDRLRDLAPDVMNEMTHEIYWDTPGAPCDLAALQHAARYHVSPNACRGIAPRPRPGQAAPAIDPQKLRAELIGACYQARQIFYSHRGLPLYCLEFYGAATEDHQGSLTPEVQDRQVVSWLLGAPLVFSGDLSTLSPEHLAHYQKRFALVNRLHRSWDIYRHFQFSGVPAPTDDDWHWWGKLNDEGCGAVVVVRGSAGAERRAINIPWVNSERRYVVTASFTERRLGDFTGRQLQSTGVEVALPVYGQEILELAPAQ